MCCIYKRPFIHSVCQSLTWVTSFAASEAESGTSGHSGQVFYLQSDERIKEECVNIQAPWHMQEWCFVFVCISPCHCQNWDLLTQKQDNQPSGPDDFLSASWEENDTASVSSMSTYSRRYLIQQMFPTTHNLLLFLVYSYFCGVLWGNLHNHSKFWGNFLFLKEVFYIHQGSIYLIKSTVKIVIL